MTSESILYHNIHTCNSRVTLHDVTIKTHLTSPPLYMWLKVVLCGFYVVKSGVMWFYMVKSGCMWLKVVVCG